MTGAGAGGAGASGPGARRPGSGGRRRRTAAGLRTPGGPRAASARDAGPEHAADTAAAARSGTTSMSGPGSRWEGAAEAAGGYGTLLAALAALATALIALSTLSATRDQLSQAEQGQVTTRYTAAVAQLGDPALEVRLGGIYALERLARDSPRDQPTVIEVLAAYIRHKVPTAGGPACAISPPLAGRPTPDFDDVVAALKVLARRDRGNPVDPASTPDLSLTCLRVVALPRDLDLDGFDLAGVDLHDAVVSLKLGRAKLTRAAFAGADLTESSFVGADLSYANLTTANLTTADVRGADLEGSNLTGASLYNATLTGANLTEANLRDANLSSATLARAGLVGADLTGANLHADLTDAKLNSARLYGANLTGADLAGANLTDATLTAARLVVANLYGADLSRANLSLADLAGANLLGATLTGADLRGSRGARLLGSIGQPAIGPTG